MSSVFGGKTRINIPPPPPPPPPEKTPSEIEGERRRRRGGSRADTILTEDLDRQGEALGGPGQPNVRRASLLGGGE